jgi:hypothetical protein
MSNPNPIQSTPNPIEVPLVRTIRLENVKVLHENLTKYDLFGKSGLTIQANHTQQFDDFTTIKSGVLPVIRCAGKPTKNNIIGDIELGDIVNVLVTIESYGEDLYPRLKAVKLVSKGESVIDETDYSNQL